MRGKKDKEPKHVDYGFEYSGSFTDKGTLMKNLEKAKRYDKSPYVTISGADYILVGSESATIKRANVPGAEIMGSGDPDAYVMDNFGDGSYILEGWDKDHEFLGKYKTNIGDVKEKKQKKKSEDGDETKSSKKSTDAIVTALINQNTELQKAYMQSMTDMRQSRTSSSEDLEHIAKTLKELRGDDGEMRQLQIQFMSAAIQNLLNPQSSLEEMLRTMQAMREFAPQLQQEDNTLNSLLNLVVSLFAARAGGGQPELTPQQLQMVKQYIPQLQGQQPLPPGQTQAQPQPQAPLAGAQPQPQTTPQPQAQTPTQDISKSSNDEHRQFYNMYIDKIRRAVTGGQSDYDIAKKIIDMMEYSVDYMRNDPHPLVAGMVSNMDNPVGLNAELYKFFDAIPELAGLKQKQDSIHANIVEIYTGGPGDDADNADVGEIGDADQQDREADSDKSTELEDDPSQVP